MKLLPCAVITLCATSLLSSCGGGSSFTYPQNVTVTMSPAVTSLPVGTTQQFSAAVSGYSATPTWNVQGSTNPTGTITQTGLYTAPPIPPIINYGGSPGPEGVVTVTASVNYPSPTLFFGATASATQTFVITAPTITAGILPATASVALGGTFKFQPYAVGSTNRAYTLQVNGVTGGSMSTGTIVTDAMNAGLYTAPTVMPMTGNTVTITVISAADPTRTGTATVTLH